MAHQASFTSLAQYTCLEDLRQDYVDLCLCYCGTEDCAPGSAFGPTKRTNYLIHVVTKGKGFFQADGKTYHLSENQAFLITPDIVTYYEADKTDPWSYIWIGFCGIKAHECATSTGLTTENPVNTYTCVPALTANINQILDAHQLTFVNELKRTSLMISFLATMIEDHLSSNPNHNRYDYPGAIYVKHAVNYLSKNYCQKIKITELAQYIGINRSYLTISFKKIMKVSPQEFLVGLRMDKAASLLRQTDSPINSIANSVGYEDPLAFSKIFKHRYGVSPKTFRKTPDSLVRKTQKGGCI